jgi:hypothetical protein
MQWQIQSSHQQWYFEDMPMADSQRYEEAYLESLAGTNPGKFNIIYCEEGDAVKYIYNVVCAPFWKQANVQTGTHRRIRRMMVAPVDVLVEDMDDSLCHS